MNNNHVIDHQGVNELFSDHFTLTLHGRKLVNAVRYVMYGTVRFRLTTSSKLLPMLT